MLVTSTVGNDARAPRNVWFWRAKRIGQSDVEVPDLPRLIDAAAARVIGSPHDQPPPISGATSRQGVMFVRRARTANEQEPIRPHRRAGTL